MGITAEQWNERFEIGQPVTFRPVRGEIDTVTSKTKSKAWALAGGTVVVVIAGRIAAVGLDWVHPIHEEDLGAA